MSFRIFSSLAVGVILVLISEAALAQQWQQTASFPKGSGITDLAVKQSNGYLFATTGSFDWPNADTGGVHRSTDGGNTWTRVFPAYVARMVAVHPDGRIFASVWDYPVENEGLYSSTDDGDSWVQAYDGPQNNNVFCFAYDPLTTNRMFAGLRDILIFSNAGGEPGTWSVITPAIFGVWALQVAIQTPFFGNGRVFLMVQNPTTMVGGVYYSDNPPGSGWSLMQGLSASDTLVSMAIFEDTVDVEALYVGTFSGRIYKSVLLGSTPPPFSLVYESPELESITAFDEVDLDSGSDGVLRPKKRKKSAKDKRHHSFSVPEAAGNGGGVVETLDNGLTWQDDNDGLPDERRMSALASYVTSSNTATVYAGLFLDQNDGGPVYSREVVTTDIDDAVSPPIPETVALDQNYPNPFNPTTTISFQLSAVSHIDLRVYDLLGREVATLVNEKRAPGTYEVTWDATGQTSGVYFYRLRVGEYIETKKLVLLR